ncbi:MAG: DUF1232 domain-containing protein [Chloroflexi bacterium]|nr:DUF1232 domain-containing protein [Chloroflexota bacterium]
MVWRLFIDKRVSPFTKIIPLLAIAYIALPYDVIADRIPLLGQFDDLIVTTILFLVFIAASPNHVIADQTIGRKLRDLQKQQGFDPDQFDPSQFDPSQFGQRPGQRPGESPNQPNGNTVDAEFKYVDDEELEEADEDSSKK